ncbi:MAG: glycosyltransferase family 4 protein [Geminicoccaceae bacterium]
MAATHEIRPSPRLPRIAYLIPEFPGQTHTWIWRELIWMRRWGADVRLVSTRPPLDRDRARHAFAAEAAAETFYLLPHGRSAAARLLADTVEDGVARPGDLWRAIRAARTLPVEGNRWGRRVLPLVPAAARLARLCRSERITHVHCHTCARGAVVTMLAQAMGGPPYSLCINANLSWWGGAMAEKIGGSAFSTSTMRWVTDEIIRDYPPEISALVHYAPVGVDTELWRPLPVREPLSGHALNLVCVGRMHASKGFDVALRAVRQCLDRGVDVCLRLLGDGPERAALTALAEQLGLGPNVDFRGSVREDEVRRTMGAADIFLLPSHAEPLGVVVMEAMAMATPVIVTAAGGVGEIVTGGVDALTVAPGDVDQLAAAILDLAADPARRRELGLRGRESVVARFDARIGARTLFRLIYGREPIDRGARPDGETSAASASASARV